MEASTSTSQPSQPDPSHPHTHTDPPLPNTIPLVDLSHIEEPEVDSFWSGQDGKIERKRDPAFCRHGEKGMCDYCMPLEVSSWTICAISCGASYIVWRQIRASDELMSVLLAVRHEVSGRTADQTSIVPRIPPKTLFRTTDCNSVRTKSTAPHTPIIICHHTMSNRITSPISRRHLLDLPAIRLDPHLSIVPHG